MACGCKNAAANPNVTEDEASSFEVVHPLPMLPNETVECYSQRAANNPDTSQPPEENKIATLSIPVDCEMKVNTPFKMTPQSSLPVTWEMSLKDEQGADISPDSIGLSFDTNSGNFSGTIKPDYEKKKFTAAVKAIKDGTPVDQKTYVFVGKKCDPSDLRFIHPSLPTARVSSKYGPRVPPEPGASDFHHGVDFATHGVAEIVASADGVVTFVGVQRGYGNCIEIEHRSPSGKVLASTFYAHLSRTYVSRGQQVGAGTAIGHEGNTGISSGPHLHFEIRLEGSKDKRINPLEYINGKIIENADSESNPDPANADSPNTIETENTNRALTQEEVEAKSDCIPIENNPLANDPQAVAAATGIPFTVKPTVNAIKAPYAACRPSGPEGEPNKEQFKGDIDSVLEKHPELDEDQKQYIRKTAAIESGFDRYAKAKTTSAQGPFQMVNKTAADLYAKIGVELTCENRADAKIATEAMIVKVKEDTRIYNKYKSTGQILGRTPPANANTAKYNSLSKQQFLYMVHHDGAGTVQRGGTYGRIKLLEFES